MKVLDLVRPDLREFAGYASARRGTAQGRIWLNANESAWPASGGVERYPEPQPRALGEGLAALYGVTAEQVLVGRGSDEAIDLLVRALCRPERDAVIVTPPVFGMYAVSARLQNAPLVDVPLLDDETFAPKAEFTVDFDAIERVAKARATKIVFLCSPANPTGGALPLEAIAALASALRGQSLVVVDEAYGEYSDVASATTLMPAHPNLAVLRTLSKAHGLAAARIGCLLAPSELIALLRNCQAPYPLPSPSVALALEALLPASLARTRERVSLVRVERERLRAALARVPGVRRVYSSQGNFLLVRFHDADAAFASLLAQGVVVRDMRSAPQLGDALRITIGLSAENDAVLAALGAGVGDSPVRDVLSRALLTTTDASIPS